MAGLPVYLMEGKLLLLLKNASSVFRSRSELINRGEFFLFQEPKDPSDFEVDDLELTETLSLVIGGTDTEIPKLAIAKSILYNFFSHSKYNLCQGTMFGPQHFPLMH